MHRGEQRQKTRPTYNQTHVPHNKHLFKPHHNITLMLTLTLTLNQHNLHLCPTNNASRFCRDEKNNNTREHSLKGNLDDDLVGIDVSPGMHPSYFGVVSPQLEPRKAAPVLQQPALEPDNLVTSKTNDGTRFFF